MANPPLGGWVEAVGRRGGDLREGIIFEDAAAIGDPHLTAGLPKCRSRLPGQQLADCVDAFSYGPARKK